MTSFGDVLRWLWRRPKGYWCDGCKKWAKRRDGKALVRVKADGVKLYCVDCAKTVVEAERQLRETVVYDDHGDGRGYVKKTIGV
jgi:hypothetical protein